MGFAKGWRTLAFNVVMGTVTLVNIFNPGAIELPADQVAGAIELVDAAIASVWAIGNILLRAITDTPIGSKT